MKAITTVLCAIILSACSSARHTDLSESPENRTKLPLAEDYGSTAGGILIVYCTDSSSVEKIARHSRKMNLKIVYKYKLFNALAVKVSDTTSPAAAAKALKKRKGVIAVRRNAVNELQTDKSFPSSPQL